MPPKLLAGVGLKNIGQWETLLDISLSLSLSRFISAVISWKSFVSKNQLEWEKLDVGYIDDVGWKEKKKIVCHIFKRLQFDALMFKCVQRLSKKCGKSIECYSFCDHSGEC